MVREDKGAVKWQLQCSEMPPTVEDAGVDRTTCWQPSWGETGDLVRFGGLGAAVVAIPFVRSRRYSLSRGVVGSETVPLGRAEHPERAVAVF